MQRVVVRGRYDLVHPHNAGGCPVVTAGEQLRVQAWVGDVRPHVPRRPHRHDPDPIDLDQGRVLVNRDIEWDVADGFLTDDKADAVLVIVEFELEALLKFSVDVDVGAALLHVRLHMPRDLERRADPAHAITTRQRLAHFQGAVQPVLHRRGQLSGRHLARTPLQAQHLPAEGGADL